MTHYKKALEYYELDGWVTEHCNTQMEISNLYRHATGKRNAGCVCQLGALRADPMLHFYDPACMQVPGKLRA